MKVEKTISADRARRGSHEISNGDGDICHHGKVPT